MRYRLGLAAGLAAVCTPAGAQQTLQERIDGTRGGDTLFVPAGIYHECITITQPLVMLAARDVVISGNCAGTVVTVLTGATIKGFTIEGSGSNLSHENAGLWADKADSLTVEDTEFRDVLFGIYIKESVGVVIRGNQIEGKDLPIAARGDAIRLWYSRAARIEDNQVTRARDLVVWFSDSVVVRHNTISDGRYGLHYMYSHHSRFEDNAFVRNEVGAFLMYSTDITFRRNLFAHARGILGKGLGFKDSERIVATGNTIVKNAMGLYLDNSPSSRGVTNQFTRNTLAYNDVAVGLLPSVRHNEFRDNDFLHNGRPVTISGGGTANGNTWRGNHWTEYAGFDRDQDGLGDTPFAWNRWSEDLFGRHAEAQIFALSPAAAAADLLGRLFPSLQPEAVVVDSMPRLRPGPTRPADAPPTPWLPATLFLVAAIGAGATTIRAHVPGGRA